MPAGTKRKRSAPNGLVAGERLKRDKLVGPELHSQWGWVSHITAASQITPEHRRAACGFCDVAGKPICSNKHGNSKGGPTKINPAHIPMNEMKSSLAENQDSEDVIIISSDDGEKYVCNKKHCKDNPQCVNYIGQASLEKNDALETFLEAASLGSSPLIRAREGGIPIGLKNLGATCYANAFIQVWFQDRAFRDAVYRCLPSQEEGQDPENSPVFQLQVTFAALQESKQNVFNPVKLVESLQIRASEQQDAQEFSKLFMSHLATEFEKQAVPSLKTLISDQFEGKQTYGTMCRNCGHRSERDANFLELEVNPENNGKLEERINALLQSEELTDDNKYFCSRCDGLQNATRYTKLRKMPPVLHISILRFVFDVSTLSRKKSKESIRFPSVLDMSAFVDERDDSTVVPVKRAHPGGEDENDHPSLRYELRGVLLHKGPSAYHGHYEALVFDSTTRQLYQFNDEIVTPMNSLQSKKALSSKEKAATKDDGSAAANKRRRTYSRKKVRVEDSDGEVDTRPYLRQDDHEYLSSKDAYMLIYARHDESSSDASCDRAPKPPLSARERVAKLNNEYDRACASYIERKKSLASAFNRMCQSRKSIYSHWEIGDHREESAVVSRNALLVWITRGLAKLEDNDIQDPSTEKTRSLDHSKEQNPISRSDTPCDPLDLLAPSPVPDRHLLDNSEIVCRHGKLDPRKASEMKRINNNAIAAINTDTDCFFEPEITTNDVCEHCIQELFLDKRYSLDHPRDVSQFEEIYEAESESQGAWISKRWLADWRQAKPKMHISGKEDPPPDAPEYAGHVRCTHDRLSLISVSRKRISGEACAFLQSLFPAWRPLPDDARICEICEEELHVSKEVKQELKKQTEDEKTKLRNLLSATILTLGPEIIPGVTQAIVPTVFLRQWRDWLGRPRERSRPGPIDNSCFFCEHDRLTIDPNVPKDLGTTISLVSLSDWEILQELYGGGPLISLTGAAQDGPQSEPVLVDHDFEVCNACRQERLTNFDEAVITIQVLGDDEPNPTPGDSAGTLQQRVNVVSSSSPKRARPTRTSYRLKKTRSGAHRREVTILKSSVVKDIKIQLYQDMDIPTISQRLFFNGVELTNNLATMASLGVMANDTMCLREEKEKEEEESKSDAEPERRDEGRAFGGTILSGAPRKQSTPPTDEDAEELRVSSSAREDNTGDSCPACTFINAEGLSECSVCGSKL